MSRPPRPHFREATTGLQEARRDRIDYLPLEFAELLALEERLAALELGLASSEGEGDFARTLMEASAVLAHLLGIYQDVYAREAWLATAQSPASLVRHARRLAYQPDRGLSATGWAALTVGKDLAGTVEKGLALASVPRGAVKAQDYETLEDVAVKAPWNALRPVDATIPASFTFVAGRATLRIAGAGHGLEPGDQAILLGPAANQRWALVVEDSVEEPGETEDATLVTVHGTTVPVGPVTLPAYVEDDPSTHYRLLVRPQQQLHPFAWNADSVQYPPNSVKNAGAYVAPNLLNAVAFGWVPSPNALDVFLAEEVTDPLQGQWVLHAAAGALQPLKVTAEQLKAVSLRRGEVVGIQQPLFNADGTPQLQNNLIKTQTVGHLVESQISASVTTWRLQNAAGQNVNRSTLAFPAAFLGGFELDLRLADRAPNPAPVAEPLTFAADLRELRPGRPVVLGDREGTRTQVVEVDRISPLDGGSALYWNEITPPPSPPLLLSEVRLNANVARIAHGKTVDEVLGGSDGVTPFLRFTLKQSPVTLLPGAASGEPAVEVRVGGVAWQRVADFHDSTPEDRHYRLDVDAEQVTTVLFGDGRRGAIPPSGKKHVTAVYKVGLGADGNIAAGGVSRIKRAHPLVETAVNPTPVAGGAAPADAGDVRHQATRFVLTFDRAVSVQDHADLALLFPGVARAAASWSDEHGVELVLADGEGAPLALAVQAAVAAFLDQRRDTEVPLALVDPQAVDLFLTVVVEHDPAWLSEAIRLAVQDALFGEDEDTPGMFTFAARSFGQAAHLSQVYGRLAQVPGVDFIRVTRFTLGSAGGVFDVLRASPRQWLRLQPSACDVAPSPKEPTP